MLIYRKSEVKNNSYPAEYQPTGKVGSGKGKYYNSTTANNPGFFNPIKLPALQNQKIQKSDIPAKAKAEFGIQ